MGTYFINEGKHMGVIVAQTLTECIAVIVQRFNKRETSISEEETILHQISGSTDSLPATAAQSSSPWTQAERRSRRGRVDS